MNGDFIEPINYYEPTIKTAKIQSNTYSIKFNHKELYKEIERLQQELQRKDNIINELKEELEFELQFQKGGCYNRIKNLLDKIKELENDK